MNNPEMGRDDPPDKLAKYDAKSEITLSSEGGLVTEKEKIIQELTEKSTGDFRLYKDAESRDLFRSDVEKMCRHAFAIGADVMLFCDKSARGYGLLAHKILPIIRLEYSMLKNIDINEIKIPDVKFFNPEIIFLEKKYLSGEEKHEADRELSQQSDEQILDKNEKATNLEMDIKHSYFNQLGLALQKYIAGKTVLVCDESTQGENYTVPHGKVEPSKQYEFYNNAEINLNRATLIESPEINPMLRVGKAYRVTHELLNIFPNSHFDVHLGESDLQEGHDVFTNSDLSLAIKNIESPETDIDLGYSIDFDDESQPLSSMAPKVRKFPYKLIAKKVEPMVKRKTSMDEQWKMDAMTKSGFKDINELRIQYRAELKKIAAESAKELLK